MTAAISTAGLLLFGAGLQSLLRMGNQTQKPVAQSGKDMPSAAKMAAASRDFYNALTPEQRAKAAFAFTDDQRFDWHFVPRPRKGVPLKELDPSQRRLANALLSAGVSPKGLTKATTIMSMESVLREIENGNPIRDPELYFFSLFGDPASDKPWGWRLEGHHISLNFAIVGGGQAASTPSFFGSNPAELRHGPRKGLRPLSGEEDLARGLLKSLDDTQRAVAVISQSAPAEILSGNSRKAELIRPPGIQASKLSQSQAEILMKLLSEYADNMPADIAAARMERLKAAGVGNLSFAWAGGAERGQPHYYRIQGPTLLIEYDNTQNNANHIHTVWRDFGRDFGLDLLAQHYENAHRDARG